MNDGELEMPLYEYRCTECDHSFEILQRMGEGADGLDCPSCGEPRVEKQFSTFAAGSGSGTSNGVGASCGRGACGGGAGFT